MEGEGIAEKVAGKCSFDEMYVPPESMLRGQYGSLSCSMFKFNSPHSPFCPENAKRLRPPGIIINEVVAA